MDRKTKSLFLILVLVQGLHSVEEFVGRLWETFPPATILCGLVSNNLVTGFLIINIGLFVFGLLCWNFPIRKEYRYASVIIGVWIGIELVNGIGHPVWTIMQRGYTPGIITAPILLAIAIMLLQQHFAIYNKA